MKRIYSIFILMMVLVGTSEAQNYGLGLGIILGEPTGISVKYWTSRITAVDGAIAWSLGKHDRMYFHGDYLWHNDRIINITRGRLPIYYGVGARLGFNGDSSLGIRGVIGLDYQFATIPLDIFLELVPVMNLAPSTDFDFNGAIGVRYFF